MNVSLIIPSRGRPEHLRLLLSALRFQRGVIFEVIVVSDLSEAAVRALAPAGAPLKCVPCDVANLSRARNLGIAASGADIVAFCDDDAVPEPNWLARLSAPFANQDVQAACGFVRGRNGVSYQWKAMVVDAYGNDQPLDVNTPALSDQPIKTVGTNSAFRKSALLGVGGFDEAYHFFLEDADINRRLTKAGGQTAIVPSAEVHHAYAPSTLRHFNRVPKSLLEIGASKAHFCAVHGQSKEMPRELEGFYDAQKKRLHRFFNLGLVSGQDINRLLTSLRDGFEEGKTRRSITPLTESQAGFTPYFAEQREGDGIVLKAGFFGARAKHKQAAELAARGEEVTLLQFIYSPRKLTVRFTPEGYWLHRGGVFGQGARTDPLLQWSTRGKRLEQEAERLARIRTKRTN